MRTARLLLALAGAFALSIGCTRAPEPGEPIGRDDVLRLSEVLSATGAGIAGLQGSGAGEATVSGRGTAVSFAFVYSDPDWLRVDVRPELGGAGHVLSSLSILDGQCLRSYFPGQAAEVRGCLSDLTDAIPDVDLAALALGIPRLRWLGDLADTRVARRGERITLTGTLSGRRVTLMAEGAPPSVSEVDLELSPRGRTVHLTYSGRGWHGSEALPRSIEIAVQGGRPEARIKLTIKKARAVDHVARDEYELEVPPGARSLTWRDLDVGREE
jgi:hypothetical protein